jgi:hypothetical protein
VTSADGTTTGGCSGDMAKHHSPAALAASDALSILWGRNRCRDRLGSESQNLTPTVGTALYMQSLETGTGHHAACCKRCANAN